jgi:hypothetical protein
VRMAPCWGFLTAAPWCGELVFVSKRKDAGRP